ncbi:Ribosomal protein S6 kinase 2 beta-like [Homarus americanus]|uniref:Ribosomal protein S6 kinase 2 beta-like n=1 Tax=Homarus americanus TaxID=6706 RepID=A0A8J5MIX4_HOMAM|nr:Ribosomal protein S6 kinase 2 beta-like [Homarus americanus]
MEYCPGETIGRLFKRKSPMSLEALAQLFETMERLHAKQVVHLDLHKSNVLVNEIGDTINTKIIDFGRSELTVEATREAGMLFDRLSIHHMTREVLPLIKRDGPSSYIRRLLSKDSATWPSLGQLSKALRQAEFRNNPKGI